MKILKSESFLAVLLSILTITVSALGLPGCNGTSITNDSPPELQFAEGERLLKKDRYLEAVERFRVVRSRFPYSKYAALAALRIGDAHFQEESWVEAAGAYKTFRELYPKHESSGYALFRIGESNYNMLPGTIDRDLESATAAIEAYQEFAKQYPNSADIERAQKRSEELKVKLAQKEDYIGNYYFIRNHYSAAATRYKNLLDLYPNRGLDAKALYRLAFSYQKLGEVTKAEEAIETLRREFSNTTFAKEAEPLWALLQKEKSQ